MFTGDVVANTGAANTLELASGAGAGTISGLGSQFQNFQTVTIDSGASWTVGGTISGPVDGIDMGAGASLTVAAGSSITGTATGVYLADGGSLTNETSGSIGGGRYGVYINDTTGTVDNSGTIIGTGKNSNGVYLGAGGSLTNETNGSIGGVLWRSYRGLHRHGR